MFIVRNDSVVRLPPSELLMAPHLVLGRRVADARVERRLAAGPRRLARARRLRRRRAYGVALRRAAVGARSWPTCWPARDARGLQRHVPRRRAQLRRRRAQHRRARLRSAAAQSRQPLGSGTRASSRPEPGLTIEGLWRRTIQDGYWPAVVPGTMHPTLGGCLSMNVHGKNNYRAGPFGDHVVELRSGDAARRAAACSRTRERRRVLRRDRRHGPARRDHARAAAAQARRDGAAARRGARGAQLDRRDPRRSSRRACRRATTPSAGSTASPRGPRRSDAAMIHRARYVPAARSRRRGRVAPRREPGAAGSIADGMPQVAALAPDAADDVRRRRACDQRREVSARAGGSDGTSLPAVARRVRVPARLRAQLAAGVRASRVHPVSDVHPARRRRATRCARC